MLRSAAMLRMLCGCFAEPLLAAFVGAVSSPRLLLLRLLLLLLPLLPPPPLPLLLLPPPSRCCFPDVATASRHCTALPLG